MTVPGMPSVSAPPAARPVAATTSSDGGSPFAAALDGALGAGAGRSGDAPRATPPPRSEGRPDHSEHRGVGRRGDDPGRRTARGRGDGDRESADDDRAGSPTDPAAPGSGPVTADPQAPAVDPNPAGLPLWAMAAAVVVPVPLTPPAAAPTGNDAVGGVGAAGPAAPAGPAGALPSTALPSAADALLPSGAAPLPGAPVPVPGAVPGTTGQPAAGAAVPGAAGPAAGTPALVVQAGAPADAAGALPATGTAPPTTAPVAAPAVVAPAGAAPPPPAVPPTPATDGTTAGTTAIAPPTTTAPGAGGSGTGSAGSDPDRHDDPAPSAAPAASALPAGVPVAPVAAPVAAAAGTAPAAAPPPVASQLVPYVAVFRGAPDGHSTMTVVLTPENLGPVRVEVTMGNGALDLTLRGAHEAGRAALMAAMPELRRDLASAGLTLNRAEVDHDTGGSWTAQQQSGQHQPGQQFAGDGRGWSGWNRSGDVPSRPWMRSGPPSAVQPRTHSDRATPLGVDVRV